MSQFVRQRTNKLAAAVTILIVLAILLVARHITVLKVGVPLEDKRLARSFEHSSVECDSRRDVEGNECRLHYVRSTPGSTPHKLAFLLVHGGSVEQVASHWSDHLQFFANMGSVWAVDLLGHGRSSGVMEVPVAEQVAALKSLWRKERASGQRLIIVGRSKSVDIVLQTASETIPFLAGVVLIAPAYTEDEVQQASETHARLTTVPTLFVWAENDSIISSSRSDEWLKHFTHSASRLVMVHEGDGEKDFFSWQSHVPEKMDVDRFQAGVKLFIKRIGT
eukprot:TRINITY_DN13088_c0_g1_i1.p1 TRINITY_DN13088_c0_g1~~TRINITY_DN13088_c0_g1_i1.p1  ORF type:complete len:278 (+),score=57.71 TRINITY_DN13088_c0_g1_i1:153-986(+)